MPMLDPGAKLQAMVDGYLKGNIDDGEDGLGWLHAQSPRMLVDIDGRRRSWWAPRSSELLECLRVSPQAPAAVKAAALFLAGADGNGRTRQAALQRMDALAGRLTLSSALLRCNDWVPEVRVVAQQVVEVLLSRCSIDDVLAAWPLAVRLQDAQRVDADWRRDTLEGWLSAPSQRAVLGGLLVHRDSLTRLSAHAIAFDVHPERVAIRARALRDSDPRIARMAFQDLLDEGDPSQVVEQCSIALTAPSSQVRASALRTLVAHEVEGIDVFVEDALFDRARAVRSLAAFLVRQRHATPAIELWRSALAQQTAGRWRVALEALADHAVAEDVALLRSLYPRVTARHRRNCVRGWIRAEGGAGLALLRVALEEPGRSIHELLTHAQADWVAELDAPRLLAFCHDGPSPVAQTGLLRLLPHVPLWQHLELLLDAVPQRQDERAWHLRLVENWLRVSESYSPLSAARRQALLTRLEHGGHDLSNAMAQRLAEAVRQA